LAIVLSLSFFLQLFVLAIAWVILARAGVHACADAVKACVIDAAPA
jgi:hypothetical protein